MPKMVILWTDELKALCIKKMQVKLILSSDGIWFFEAMKDQQIYMIQQECSELREKLEIAFT